MDTRSAPLTLSSRPIPATSEFEEAFDSLRTRERELFVLRQRLAHRRLSGETLPGFREDYRRLREEEEEIRFQIMRLENRWRVDPRIDPRKRTQDYPDAARRLRRRMNLLMITVLAALVFLFLLGR